MIGRKSLFGISVLCGLALCAFAAANASAEQRAFGCEPTPGSGEFTDAHCISKAGTGFTHVGIANGTPTKLELTNAKTAAETEASTPWELEGSLSGVEAAVKCTGVGGSGDLENNVTSVNGSGVLRYTGCTVTRPLNENCTVKNEEVTSEKFEIAGTTAGQFAGVVKFTPLDEKLAVTDIEGCNIAALNNPFTVQGIVFATATGATLTTTHASVTGQPAGERLKWGAVKAGLEGKLTIRMAGGGNPITLT